MSRQMISGWIAVGTIIMMMGGLAGCGHRPPPDTGAKAAATHYLEEFQKQAWAEAYAALDSETRAGEPLADYTQWATDYRRRLGFEVETFVVVSCNETGDRAMAQATLGGHSGERHQTRNTSIMLQRRDGNWGVVLPASTVSSTAPPK